LKRAVAALEGRAKEDVTVYAYGKKGEEYFRRRGYTIARAYANARDDVPLALMEELVADLTTAFTEGAFDRVVTVYSHFVSTFEQAPTARRLLPLSLGALGDIVAGITPAAGKWSREPMLDAPAAYTIESPARDVLGLLVPRLIAIALYHMLLEAKAAEHSARMVAMKNASDKSKEVSRDLVRLANRIRQAAITREVSEIIGGREALAT
jgi:F-type H+-transporting ATPase subunit gamma